jgi:amino acid adenylation domain-containing protein
MRSLSALIFEASNTFSLLNAIKIGIRYISYRELNNKALSVAAALNKFGAINVTVGLVGQRKASSYFGILGIIYGGCHYTPINPKYSPEKLKAIIEDAGICVLVGDVEDLLKLEIKLGEEAFPKIVIIPEGIAPTEKKWIDELTLNNISAMESPVLTDTKKLAYLLYTSGSTGKPKGVKVTHENITSFVKNMKTLYKLEPGFRASQTFDFSFDPSVSDMFFTWSAGGQLCILPEDEMMLPSEYIKREKINYWNSVPSLATFMNKMGQLTKNAFPELRFSMFCGEQFPKHIADAWRDAAPNSTIENLYGPTEATIYISRYVYDLGDVSKEFKNSILPIGQPFPDHVVAIVDNEGNELKKGEIGEICYKGAQVTDGYLDDSEKTDAVFVNFLWDYTDDCKWYKTGDLGFINADGNVECIGRRDNQIKLGGRRIEIGEIEAVLAKFSVVNDAVVVALRDENDIVTGCVAYTMNDITKEDEIIIRNESAALIERVFFPKKIITIKKFPLTASGKIDRKALAFMAKESLILKSKKL